MNIPFFRSLVPRPPFAKVWWLPDTTIDNTVLGQQMNAILNAFGGLVVAILCLAASTTVVWGIRHLYRSLLSRLKDILQKADAWFTNVDESIVSLKTRQDWHSTEITSLERLHQSQQKKIAEIEKLLASLKAHTGYQSSEALETAAKQFTEEQQ
jgi:hypothetical protein